MHREIGVVKPPQRNRKR
jgi:hypothetical protein